MEKQRYVTHKVEASNPALRKLWAPNRARGANGATGYLLSPYRDKGRKGSNLVINSPASVRSKAGRTNGLIERPLPDSYAAIELRGADYPASVIPPIRRKYFGEV
jgi:hypothetical protein